MGPEPFVMIPGPGMIYNLSFENNIYHTGIGLSIQPNLMGWLLLIRVIFSIMPAVLLQIYLVVIISMTMEVVCVLMEDIMDQLLSKIVSL